MNNAYMHRRRKLLDDDKTAKESGRIQPAEPSIQPHERQEIKVDTLVAALYRTQLSLFLFPHSYGATWTARKAARGMETGAGRVSKTGNLNLFVPQSGLGWKQRYAIPVFCPLELLTDPLDSNVGELQRYRGPDGS